MLKRVLPFLVAFLTFRLVFWFATFPNPDEAYYWLWGKYPALSYYDHPPFHAWVQGIFTALLGRSLFVLRLPNLLSNAAFFYCYYQISNYLYGKWEKDYFWITLSLILASPLYFLFFGLAWNDHWLVIFSLSSAYLFIRFLDSYLDAKKGNTLLLYSSAFLLGLAFLCKYNAVFVGAGFVATVLSLPALRSLLRDRRFYIAILITLSALLPVLVWNFSNDFQSFRYYATRSVDVDSFQLKWAEPLNFLLFSILMVSPLNGWAMVKAIRQPDIQIRSDTIYRTVALWIFAISTVSLTAIALFSTAFYYWNITAYLLLFPLLPSVFLKSPAPHTPHPTLRAPKLFTVGQLYGLLFAALLVVHYSVIPLSAFADPSSDPDSRMLFGWDAVGRAVQTQQQELGESFLVTTDYRSASALAYELNDPAVMAISDRIDQFDVWYNPDLLSGKNAVILADDWHPPNPKLLAQFDRTSKPIAVPIYRFGRSLKTYYVIKGYLFQKNDE
ncbi:glycosyltransferase family 39 protein [Phormidium sp. CLA17]|uniref:ArnT family glycosyltransferase n=1 Tax=Leptolyngbya sp. Cla-17 TaxID=2803751 RepID=UPI0014915B4B|nr:glycosyltransferase family 39 protein [Leptolyngbya sp. Cla-17]MBM0743428.1 glycosyltransferase family 39 protein [Leptolyngbya sp. Cla-17]